MLLRQMNRHETCLSKKNIHDRYKNQTGQESTYYCIFTTAVIGIGTILCRAILYG